MTQDSPPNTSRDAANQATAGMDAARNRAGQASPDTQSPTDSLDADEIRTAVQVGNLLYKDRDDGVHVFTEYGEYIRPATSEEITNSYVPALTGIQSGAGSTTSQPDSNTNLREDLSLEDVERRRRNMEITLASIRDDLTADEISNFETQIQQARTPNATRNFVQEINAKRAEITNRNRQPQPGRQPASPAATPPGRQEDNVVAALEKRIRDLEARLAARDNPKSKSERLAALARREQRVQRELAEVQQQRRQIQGDSRERFSTKRPTDSPFDVDNGTFEATPWGPMKAPRQATSDEPSASHWGPVAAHDPEGLREALDAEESSAEPTSVPIVTPDTGRLDRDVLRQKVVNMEPIPRRERKRWGHLVKAGEETLGLSEAAKNARRANAERARQAVRESNESLGQMGKNAWESLKSSYLALNPWGKLAVGIGLGAASVYAPAALWALYTMGAIGGGIAGEASYRKAFEKTRSRGFSLITGAVIGGAVGTARFWVPHVPGLEETSEKAGQFVKAAVSSVGERLGNVGDFLSNAFSNWSSSPGAGSEGVEKLAGAIGEGGSVNAACQEITNIQNNFVSYVHNEQNNLLLQQSSTNIDINAPSNTPDAGAVPGGSSPGEPPVTEPLTDLPDAPPNSGQTLQSPATESLELSDAPPNSSQTLEQPVTEPLDPPPSEAMLFQDAQAEIQEINDRITRAMDTASQTLPPEQVWGAFSEVRGVIDSAHSATTFAELDPLVDKAEAALQAAQERVNELGASSAQPVQLETDLFQAAQEDIHDINEDVTRAMEAASQHMPSEDVWNIFSEVRGVIENANTVTTHAELDPLIDRAEAALQAAQDRVANYEGIQTAAAPVGEVVQSDLPPLTVEDQYVPNTYEIQGNESNWSSLVTETRDLSTPLGSAFDGADPQAVAMSFQETIDNADPTARDGYLRLLFGDDDFASIPRLDDGAVNWRALPDGVDFNYSDIVQDDAFRGSWKDQIFTGYGSLVTDLGGADALDGRLDEAARAYRFGA